MRRSRPRRVVVAVALALKLLAAPATPALAHGNITGAQDVLMDYGILLFLLAVVLIGAGVVVWVMLSPQPEDEVEEVAESSNGPGEPS